MPPVPFIAQSLAELRERYPQALIKVWEITDPMPDRPGLHREHLFDFYEGIRLLISKDRIPGEIAHVHVSASWEWNPPSTLDEMKQQVLTMYKSLGGEGTLEYIGMSGKGIPHWMVKNAPDRTTPKPGTYGAITRRTY